MRQSTRVGSHFRIIEPIDQMAARHPSFVKDDIEAMSRECEIPPTPFEDFLSCRLTDARDESIDFFGVLHFPSHGFEFEFGKNDNAHFITPASLFFMITAATVFMI